MNNEFGFTCLACGQFRPGPEGAHSEAECLRVQMDSLRRQLAVVTAEMDEWRERRDNLKQTCDDRGVALEKAEAERDRLREALGDACSHISAARHCGITVSPARLSRWESALKGDERGQDD